MNVYMCDGSPFSFFTAVFNAYNDKDCVITSERDFQVSLDSNFISVETDMYKIKRVTDKIERYDKNSVNDVRLVLKSPDPKREQVAFEYIKILVKMKKPVKNAFNLPEIVAFNDILHKISIELDHMRGFLRFMVSASGALYAPYSPDNDITELLMPHFASRLNSENFVIHDVGRKIAGLYNGRDWIICPLDQAEISLSKDEKNFENLWKKYYATVNIDSRPHEKQMKGYMPVRYWKFLPEKNN